MTPYLDAGFLLTLLLRTHGSRVAAETLRRFEGPFQLNMLHQLQALNLLMQHGKEGATLHGQAGREAKRTWDHFFAEGIFEIHPADWNEAFTTALTWTQYSDKTPPPPLLILHPALAVVAGATHFLSFDPRSRSVAKVAGLKLLPEEI